MFPKKAAKAAFLFSGLAWRAGRKRPRSGCEQCRRGTPCLSTGRNKDARGAAASSVS